MNEKLIKQEKELSAARDTFASTLFNEGARLEKERVLNVLPEEFARLHRSGAFHIHDLDGWNLVNNCSTPLPEYVLHPEHLRTKTPGGRIAELFEQFKEMICTVQHRQSGGVGSCNFDREMAEALVAAGVEPTAENATAFGEQATLLFTWLSTQRLRYARENFYVTLNMGLDTSAWGRIVTHESIAAFAALPVDYTRPNLVFKVKGEINGRAGSPNYDLFLEACDCTTRKMIPTYLLMDAEPNRACDPFKINIMGCRTRVYANRNGGDGSDGRGNIAALSLNLPRIALETKEWEKFFKLLKARMNAAKRVLLLRAEAIRKSPFAAEMAESGVWAAKDVEDMCRQGTYSIGFIGLAETVEILGCGKVQSEPRAREFARRILEVMRETTDGYANETGLNFSLLASAGEGISGRFPKMDAELFPDAECWKKGFYTNSFHVPVDSGVGVFEKLAYEGPFHRFANGGCISYVELREAPIGNPECVADIVLDATSQGVSYLGINYPLDICNACGTRGTFDACPHCGSKDVKRIRRVSGYLETLDEFSVGKKAEERKRLANSGNHRE